MGYLDRFKLNKKKLDEFEQYFDVLFEKRDDRFFQLRKFFRKNTVTKRVPVLLGFTVAFGLGLIILPGSKFYLQKRVKRFFSGLYPDTVEIFSNITEPEKWSDSLISALKTRFIYLLDNDIIEEETITTALDKTTNLMYNYGEKNTRLFLNGLNFVNLITQTLIAKDPTFFFSETLQNSLLAYLEILVLKGNFENVKKDLERMGQTLLNPEYYSYRVLSYTEATNVFLVLLSYAKNNETKIQTYELFNRYLMKPHSEVLDIADYFCSLSNLHNLLKDLSSADEKISASALTTTALLFQNDDQAIKLLKTKMLSNMIKYRAGQNEYVRSVLLRILGTVKDNKHRKTLLQESEMFKEEKMELERLSKDKAVDEKLRQSLKEFLTL